MGDFADLKSIYLAGHSTTVEALTMDVAERLRLDPAGCLTLRVAALAHDLGRVTVSAAIWDKPGPLNDSDGSLSACIRITRSDCYRALAHSHEPASWPGCTTNASTAVDTTAALVQQPNRSQAVCSRLPTCTARFDSRGAPARPGS
jgi:hypothetical protein